MQRKVSVETIEDDAVDDLEEEEGGVIEVRSSVGSIKTAEW